MASVSQQTVKLISAPWLSQTVVLNELVEADGKFFAKVYKGCNKMARILSGSSISKERALSNTDILETLMRLLSQTHAELCQASLNQQDGRDEDLGLDAAPPTKRLKQVAPVLPPTMEIVTPNVGDCKSVNMTMITASGSNPLLVEVTEDNINYLHMACKEQLDNKPMPEELADSTNRPRGITWVESRAAFRVSYKEGDKKRQKYFKPDSASDDDNRAAIEKAREFLASMSGL